MRWPKPYGLVEEAAFWATVLVVLALLGVCCYGIGKGTGLW